MNNTDNLPATAQAAHFAPVSNTATALAERERANIQAAMTVAKHFPRDEGAAAAKLLAAADRVGFAERASYAFPRGGSTVTGPSIELARTFLRSWGNIESGFAVIETSEDWTTVEAWALDLETNTRKRAQTRFRSKIQRKDRYSGETKWITPDERDYGELVNRNAAKAERNAILGLLPRDIVEDCLDRCRDTLARAAAGTIKADPAKTVRALLATYQAIGIHRDQLEAKIGGPLEAMTGENLEELRALYRGVQAGEVDVPSTFPKPDDAKASAAAADLSQRLEAASKDDDDEAEDDGEQQPTPLG